MSTSSTTDSATSSSLPIPLTHIHHLITLKLTRENYLLWKAQIIPYLKGQHLYGFLDGSRPAPTQATASAATPALPESDLPSLAHSRSNDLKLTLAPTILMISMVYSSPMSFVLLKTNPLWTSPMPRLIMSPILPLIVAATTVAGVVLEIILVQPVVPSPILNGITVVVGVVRNNSNRPVCQVCHKPGHAALTCYHRFDNSYTAESPQQMHALYASPQAASDLNWYSDSGATHHLTNDLANLNVRAEEYTGSEGIRVGNGSGLPEASGTRGE
uniref:Retrotransposon Copia-like N-terminal domain-containing protein n=1 Tax=Fagus sylvatica TaxID=28930 RepID=A0A2N9H831_FAGSY